MTGVASYSVTCRNMQNKNFLVIETLKFRLYLDGLQFCWVIDDGFEEVQRFRDVLFGQAVMFVTAPTVTPPKQLSADADLRVGREQFVSESARRLAEVAYRRARCQLTKRCHCRFHVLMPNVAV